MKVSKESKNTLSFKGIAEWTSIKGWDKPKREEQRNTRWRKEQKTKGIIVNGEALCTEKGSPTCRIVRESRSDMVNNHPLAYQTRIRQALCTTTLPFAYVHNEKARLLDVVSALLIYMYAKKDSGSIPSMSRGHRLMILKNHLYIFFLNFGLFHKRKDLKWEVARNLSNSF